MGRWALLGRTCRNLRSLGGAALLPSSPLYKERATADVLGSWLLAVQADTPRGPNANGLG